MNWLRTINRVNLLGILLSCLGLLAVFTVLDPLSDSHRSEEPKPGAGSELFFLEDGSNNGQGKGYLWPAIAPQASGSELLVNELAPRPHNSGHATIDACVTSQFEQQIRAVCCLPLGSTALRQPAAMANLLGHLWEKGEPNWAAALTDPHVKLHLYGKAQARPGRKMGHVTFLSLPPAPER